MTKAFETFLIGLDEKEKAVFLPRFHTLVAGASGTGKTEADRKIIAEILKAIPDLKVVVFDVKETGRDWEGFGHDVPIYVKTATDVRFLRDLIETSEGRKIDWFLYELSIATEKAETWREVLANLERRLEETKKRYPKGSIREEKIGILILYMKALVKDLESVRISRELVLPHQINVVAVNRESQAFKELAVYSYVSEILDKQKYLVVIDEGSLLAPRERGTGCKRVIRRLFKAGRAAELYGIVSDQEITGIDESVRRQCWNWILGMQTEVAAQKRTADQIPGKSVKPDQIATLGVGWFYAVIRTPGKTEIKKFYLLPEGIPIETGKMLVRGELSIEEMMEKIAELRMKKVDEDLVYKERCENLERRMEEMKTEMSKLREQRDEFKNLCEKLKAEMPDKVELQNMKNELERTRENLVDAQRKLMRYSSLESFLTDFVRDAVKEAVPQVSPTASEVSVNVQSTVTDFNVTRLRETLSATDKDLQGQVLLLAAEGWFKEKRRISQVRDELRRAFNTSPRPGTIEKTLAELVAKGILEREKASQGGWLYWLKPEAEKLIKVKNTLTDEAK